jgi:predicted RNA-binding Zn-ribbon protein involved in translation (DUF1610 family)
MVFTPNPHWSTDYRIIGAILGLYIFLMMRLMMSIIISRKKQPTDREASSEAKPKGGVKVDEKICTQCGRTLHPELTYLDWCWCPTCMMNVKFSNRAVTSENRRNRYE